MPRTKGKGEKGRGWNPGESKAKVSTRQENEEEERKAEGYAKWEKKGREVRQRKERQGNDPEERMAGK